MTSIIYAHLKPDLRPVYALLRPKDERRSEMRKRILCTLLALGLLLAMLPVTAAAAAGNTLDLSKGNIYIFEDGYVQSTKRLTVKEADRLTHVPHQGAYYITGTGELNYNISVNRSCDITIDSLQIRKTTASAIVVNEGNTLNLRVVGDNTLDSRVYTGIYVPEGATLNLFGDGTLEVKGADNFPGIGAGKNYSNLGTINIFGGVWVDAYGGEDAPAIGGGYVGTGKTPRRGTISISGKGTYVYAKSQTGRESDSRKCAIGSTYDTVESVDISITNGATVEAIGGIGGKDDTLKLDGTVTLWSQTNYSASYDAIPRKTTFRSAVNHLYAYRVQMITMMSGPAALDDGRGYKISVCAEPEYDGTSCYWKLIGTNLMVGEEVLRSNVERFDNEPHLGNWALINGKEEPVVTPPVQEPEQGSLLQEIVGSGLFSVPEDFPFYDVDANDWFYESVKSAWEQELIDGVTARYYMPDNTLTVAQAVKLAAALHQKQSVGFVTLQNGGTHWHDNYVNYAIANGLIEAVYQSKSAEAMNAAVTRAEFVHILSKLLNTGAINTVNSIPDVKSGDAYADEIFAFYRAGILTGSDRLGTFHPTSSLKRSEAAAILVRLYDASQRQYITLK